MKWGPFFIVVLTLSACQSKIPSTPPASRLIVQNLAVDDHLMQVLEQGQFFDRLPILVGWPDRQHPYYATDGAHELVFIDLEAEDEHRTLVIIFRQQQPIATTIIGYAPITTCYEDEPEVSETDGWVFIYDLSQGLRCLTYYFSGQVLTLVEEIPSDERQSLDLLSNQTQRQCLSDYFHHQPLGLNCRLLNTGDTLPRMQYVADDVSQILPCLP